MRIHKLTDRTEANGPGVRGLIHISGCTLNCAGCFNKDTHSFNVPNTSMSDVVDWINGLYGVEGITISGGEPLQSLREVSFLVAWLRCHRPELSIGMFTGYNLEELSRGDFKHLTGTGWIEGKGYQARALLSQLDFSISGRYVEGTPSNQPLCSSSNQVLTLHSDRYTLADFGPQRVELTVDGDSLVTTGFPSEGLRAGLKEML